MNHRIFLNTIKYFFFCVGIGFFFIFLMIPIRSFAADRQWPSSQGSVLVYSDQFNPNITNAQIEFIASHFIASLQMTKSTVDTIRMTNPSFIVLQYILGQGAGEYESSIVGNNWESIWDVVGNQDACFLTSPNSTQAKQRILETDWNWYLADIDSSCWLSFITSEVQRRMGNDHFDGVFLDSTGEPGYPFNPETWWPTGEGGGGGPGYLSYWIPKLSAFLQYVHSYFHSESRSAYIIPNVGHFASVYSTMDWSNTDGIFIEGFSRWWENQPFSLYDWKVQLNRVLQYVEKEKIMIMHSYTTRTNIRDRMFLIGNYLLTKGNHSYFSISTENNKMVPEWYPEYEVNLGSYLSVPKNIDELAIANGLYQRNYQNGRVIVNPSSEIKQYSGLNTRMYKLEIDGGGEIWEDGSYVPGVLYFSRVSKNFSIDPYSAAILVYNKPEQEIIMTPSDALMKTSGYKYSRPRLSTSTEKVLWQKLQNELAGIFGRNKLRFSSKQSQSIMNAYIYGGYPVKAIAQSVRNRGVTVHKNIPWISFRKTKGYTRNIQNGWVNTDIIPSGVYAYGKSRHYSENKYRQMERYVYVKAQSYFNNTLTFSALTWKQYSQAYAYGGYPIFVILQDMKYRGKTVHPTMPWNIWKSSPSYQKYIRK